MPLVVIVQTASANQVFGAFSLVNRSHIKLGKFCRRFNGENINRWRSLYIFTTFDLLLRSYPHRNLCQGSFRSQDDVGRFPSRLDWLLMVYFFWFLFTRLFGLDPVATPDRESPQGFGDDDYAQAASSEDGYVSAPEVETQNIRFAGYISISSLWIPFISWITCVMIMYIGIPIMKMVRHKRWQRQPPWGHQMQSVVWQ